MRFIQQMGLWTILALSSMAAVAQGVNTPAIVPGLRPSLPASSPYQPPVPTTSSTPQQTPAPAPSLTPAQTPEPPPSQSPSETPREPLAAPPVQG
jgi:hypothetical protein